MRSPPVFLYAGRCLLCLLIFVCRYLSFRGFDGCLTELAKERAARKDAPTWQRAEAVVEQLLHYVRILDSVRMVSLWDHIAHALLCPSNVGPIAREMEVREGSLISNDFKRP